MHFHCTTLLRFACSVAVCFTAPSVYVLSAAIPAPALVDLNTATVPGLMKVQGMTAGWAARIVRFRPYRTKLDLVDLGIVTPDAYKRFREGVIAHRVASSIEIKTKHQADPLADTR